jgi:Holliday junction DNA helicase RuvB
MDDIVNDILQEGDDIQNNEFENQLRPKFFSDFAGQPKIIENLKVFVEAAKSEKNLGLN